LFLVRSGIHFTAFGFVRYRVTGRSAAASALVRRKFVGSRCTVCSRLPLISRQAAWGLGLIVHGAASFAFEITSGTNVTGIGRIACKAITDAGVNAAYVIAVGNQGHPVPYHDHIAVPR